MQQCRLALFLSCFVLDAALRGYERLLIISMHSIIMGRLMRLMAAKAPGRRTTALSLKLTGILMIHPLPHLDLRLGFCFFSLPHTNSMRTVKHFPFKSVCTSASEHDTHFHRFSGISDSGFHTYIAGTASSVKVNTPISPKLKTRSRLLRSNRSTGQCSVARSVFQTFPIF